MKRTARITTLLVCLALVLGCVAPAMAEFKEPEWPAFDEEITLLLWCWAPNTEEMIAAFNEVYPNIHIEHPLTGGGNDTYTKLQTVMASGSGGPDLVQIEFQTLPQYIDAGYLLPITEYGAKYEEYVVPWIWNQCKQADELYAIPQDAGPMGYFYAKDLLAECGVEVPTTYVELKEAAKKVREVKPESYLVNFPVNDPSVITGLLWQAGWRPFHYDASADEWTIEINSDAAKKVLNYWGEMIAEDLCAVAYDWTPEWGSSFEKGTFMSFFGAAWSPVSQIQPYKTESAPAYNVALMPQWDPENPSNGNWGGSSFAVTSHSKNAEAATLLAAWMNLSEYALISDVVPGGRGLFPAGVSGYELDEFKSPDPNLDDQVAADLWIEAMETVDVSFEWSPWTNYFYDELTNELIASYEGKQTWEAALDNLQKKMVEYARSMDYEVVG